MKKRSAILKKLYDAMQRTSFFLFAAILSAILIPLTAHYVKAKVTEGEISLFISLMLVFVFALFITQQISISINYLRDGMHGLKARANTIRTWEEVYAKLKKTDVGTLLTCTMKEADEKKRLSRIVPINFYIEATIKDSETALSVMADEIQDKKDAFSRSAQLYREEFAKKCKRYGRAFGLKNFSFHGAVA